ncbi:hypothetical protein [Rubripirellula amarantea]|uniref:hypothetical protein n=1 Tax=Rubripirellula amarantea TaxID=2527999 RepID=UPI0011B4F85B|nr:hypothetical protein [Rubripirellula amarantea]
MNSLRESHEAPANEQLITTHGVTFEGPFWGDRGEEKLVLKKAKISNPGSVNALTTLSLIEGYENGKSAVDRSSRGRNLTLPKAEHL